MYGYIYKITDKKTNKIYIGQHKSSVFDENYWGSGNIIRRIIKKDGTSRLNRELLCECDSKDDLSEKEKYYIHLYNSIDPTIGYNLHAGGNTPGPVGDKEQASKNMSVAKQGNRNASGNKGLVWVHKDDVQTKVKLECVDSMLKDGWALKMLPHKQDVLDKLKDYYAAGTYINKDNETAFVMFDELDEKLSCGWKIGRAKFSDARNKKLKETKSGTICITDGSRNYYIKPDDWSKYSNQGYFKCSLYVYNKKLTELNNK